MKPYVLIVEDEDALSTLLEYNFSKEGYETAIAEDGEEALLMAEERAPDLVLLDWMLPKLSGVEVCRRLRRNKKTVRRAKPALLQDIISQGDIEVDMQAFRVRRGDKTIHLGPTEFRLLEHFIKNPGRVFSREQLLDAVWGRDVYVEARTVDVHIGRLRKALGAPKLPDPIRTVRSAGYAFEPKVA